MMSEEDYELKSLCIRVNDFVEDLRRDNKRLSNQISLSEKCFHLLTKFRDSLKTINNNCVCDQNINNKSIVNQLDNEFNTFSDEFNKKFTKSDLNLTFDTMKVKTSTPLPKDNPNRPSIHCRNDVLDSDVSSDEEVVKKEVKTDKKEIKSRVNNKTKTSDKCETNGVYCDNDSESEDKDSVCESKTSIDKVLKSANNVLKRVDEVRVGPKIRPKPVSKDSNSGVEKRVQKKGEKCKSGETDDSDDDVMADTHTGDSDVSEEDNKNVKKDIETEEKPNTTVCVDSDDDVVNDVNNSNKYKNGETDDSEDDQKRGKEKETKKYDSNDSEDENNGRKGDKSAQKGDSSELESDVKKDRKGGHKYQKSDSDESNEDHKSSKRFKKVSSDDSEEDVKRDKTEKNTDSDEIVDSDDQKSEISEKKVKKERKEKSVIDIEDSESDEDIKRRPKRRYEEDNDYNDKQTDDSSQLESSSGMDPSVSESSESGSDSNSRSKRKSKKSKNKSRNRKKDNKKRKRIKTLESSDDDCQVLSDGSDSPNKSRKNIRKIVSDKKLKKQTKDATEAERERQQRIKDKQKEYNEFLEKRSVKSSDVKELILDFDTETKEVLVEVDPTLVKFLKEHQTDGIKFMYNCLIESIEQVNESSGSGTILAHSMGLGKTLQVIAFLHTIMTNKYIKKYIKKSLVICPVNTIKNWANEFRIWLNDNDLDDLLVFEMHDAKTMPQRAELLQIWNKRGGIMIIGLTLYSNLVMGGRGKKPSKWIRETFQTCLVDPGPDVVICDEGHLLKNEKTSYNKAVSQLKTLRRVVLTGTPLQNNLNEYHVMVHFVKPNLLGTRKEFTNRFVNPINNGQHVDSTDYDVKIMKKRVHILHTLLEGCVHRRDYNVLVPYLPPKQEYVISVLLTEKQQELYEFYIKNLTDNQRFSLLADYGVLRLVWNHPILLFEQHRRRVEKANEESLDEFIDDEDVDTPVSGDSDIECMDDKDKAGPSKGPKRRMRTRNHKVEEEEEEVVATDAVVDDGMADAWFGKLLKKEEAKQIELSGKFILLFAILDECEKVGDKILLFSQSLDTLDLVEEMLKIRMERHREAEDSDSNDVTNVWYRNRDYFRLDGSTASDYRKVWVDSFNEETNYRARLFLLSTKAGGLGINLVGANRCIIFDASWNPSHDVQAIFRVFRFGQKKPVYVYRFVAQGSMEEKIYERQIIKQSLSCRVVDEQSIQRHFKQSELSEMYQFTPDRRKDRPTPKVPKDRLLAELLIKHKDYVVKYHEHDSLLENTPEEDMTEDEKLAAWNEYENEKDQLFLREQQEREARVQRANILAQQQYAQQQQAAQYQLYAQQIYAQMQSQNVGQNGPTVSFENNTNNYHSILQNQIYQNIMRSQSMLRKQQQQQYQQQTANKPLGADQASGGLPGYDRLTIEDIAKYLKNLNPNIESNVLIQRIFSIIETGLTTCTKELETVKALMRVENTPEIRLKYEKLAKEVFNLNTQKTTARTMFRQQTRIAPKPTPNDGNEQMASSSTATKSADVLIEEVD